MRRHQPYKNPQAIDLDVDELHKRMWDETDRHGISKLNIRSMATELGLNWHTVKKAFIKMEAQGRIERFDRHNYKVTNPDIWRWEHG